MRSARSTCQQSDGLYAVAASQMGLTELGEVLPRLGDRRVRRLARERARRHQIALAVLGVSPGPVLGRRRGRAALVTSLLRTSERAQRRPSQRHGIDRLAQTAHLQLAEPLLEELEVAAPLAHLGVELGADGLIVGLLAHKIRGIDEGLFPLDLLRDVQDLLVVVHGGGCLLRGGGAPVGGMVGF